MKNVGLGALAMGLASTVPAAAHAASGEASGFSIALEVPAVCDLSLQDFAIAEGEQVITGQVQEFCNSSNGFQVIASHRPLMPDEIVAVEFDGESSTLSEGGISAIAFRSGARFGFVPFRIDATRLDSGLALSFSLIAI